MKRVAILGPGASGKSTLARQLGEITGLPVIELDKIFWRTGLAATPQRDWVAVQQRLVSGAEWILDGDLGPYDAVEIRLQAADTIVFLDLPLMRCAWRALRRAPERLDFWLWLIRYRSTSRPQLNQAIRSHAAGAVIHLLRSPREVTEFVAAVARRS